MREKGLEEMDSYKELIVWQKSMKMDKEIYGLTSRFPDEEKFGLISQMRRAAVSVPSNIAEGWGRSTTGSYIQFLRISRGSLYELETQLELSKNLGYVNESGKVEGLFTEIGKMLNVLMKKLEKA